MSAILTLEQVRADSAGRVGSKAANLGELKAAGFVVPEGFVVLAEPGEALAAAVEALGGGRFAVRSSALAEDLAEASFAGQYETYLDVPAEGLSDAIRRCRDSATSARVASYRGHGTREARAGIAVLVQRMVAADAAGVAFTANPVTGDRREVVVSAVRGLGERLVSGDSTPDQWVVRDHVARRLRSLEQAISAEQATAIADLARKAEEHFLRPQDVEWALAGGQLYLLQARPMTALPPAVDWTPPGHGYWMRNLRLGEWLPEPLTPLFADWLLPLLNQGFARGIKIDVGLAAGLRQGIVNGWYYSSAAPDVRPAEALRMFFRQPRRMIRAYQSLFTQIARPELAHQRFFQHPIKRWREKALPSYRALVDGLGGRVEDASLSELFGIVDRLGEAAGEQFWCLAVGGGSAWKVEVALARFCHRELANQPDLEVQILLAGLRGAGGGVGPHAVHSLDWFRPTLGEIGSLSAGDFDERQQRLRTRRLAVEAASRHALSETPAKLQRFEGLLKLAQDYARLREEQADLATLAWPVLRRCVGRLAAEAVRRGGLASGEDAFFATRTELEDAVAGGLGVVDRERIAGRRSDWERYRRLTPPLAVGRQPRLLKRILESLEALRSERAVPAGSIRGEPASSGRASGPVRIVLGPDDFGAFQNGEVLVAAVTTPAWTPLFERAAAVVTDGGSLAAHASLVAREYGIPAVVATADATARLADGQWVTVDGSAGLVELS